VKSKSRNVNGYVSRVRRARALAERMAARDDAHHARQAPDRRRLEMLQAEISLAYGKLTGAQIAEARRLTTT